ncbi:MAG: carbonic anhydrase [Chitinophagaceae bacterium]|jgi:carbonic anhydrase|nr:carbonic anhydrase [Chitinophagaceae bacterium]
MDRSHLLRRKIKRELPFITISVIITLIAAITYFTWHQWWPLHLSKESNYERLMSGNERFAKGHPRHPDESVKHRHKVAHAQHPFALVITCSDSRLSPELIFDQGIGDLFVIRTAGNIISEIEMGSIEYAVEHLDVRCIAVMGHQDCGAIHALLEESEFPGHIGSIIDSLRKEIEIQPALKHHDLNEAITANISHQVRSIINDPLIAKLKNSIDLDIYGMYYSLESGRVQITDSLNL